MRMNPFHDQHDFKRLARRLLIFHGAFVPIFFVGISYFLRANPTPFPDYAIYAFASIPLAIAICFNVILIRSSQPLRWSVTDSRIIYESPIFLLGDSFDIPISELVDVVVIGDTDFSNCITSTGSKFKFYTKCRAGRAFYRHLAEYLKTKQQNKHELPTAGHVLL